MEFSFEKLTALCDGNTGPYGSPLLNEAIHGMFRMSGSRAKLYSANFDHAVELLDKVYPNHNYRVLRTDGRITVAIMAPPKDPDAPIDSGAGWAVTIGEGTGRSPAAALVNAVVQAMIREAAANVSKSVVKVNG